MIQNFQQFTKLQSVSQPLTIQAFQPDNLTTSQAMELQLKTKCFFIGCHY